MRQKRTAQSSIFERYAEHEIAKPAYSPQNRTQNGRVSTATRPAYGKCRHTSGQSATIGLVLAVYETSSLIP